MKYEDMLKKVDHTLLKAFAPYTDIKKLCEEAVKYECASVCIPATYIARVHKDFPTLNICTVVGFPLGYSVKESKVLEAELAIKDGANEIDMVINISDVKNGDYDKVLDEIIALKKTCGDHILKVIIETCYLTLEEKIKMCEIVTEAGADYIKTSTGFGTDGATFADIELFKEHIGPNVKMKAAGGVASVEDLEKFISLGCERVGTSRAAALVLEKINS